MEEILNNVVINILYSLYTAQMANNFISIIYYVISMIVLQSNLNFLKRLK